MGSSGPSVGLRKASVGIWPAASLAWLISELSGAASLAAFCRMWVGEQAENWWCLEEHAGSPSCFAAGWCWKHLSGMGSNSPLSPPHPSISTLIELLPGSLVTGLSWSFLTLVNFLPRFLVEAGPSTSGGPLNSLPLPSLSVDLQVKGLVLLILRQLIPYHTLKKQSLILSLASPLWESNKTFL